MDTEDYTQGSVFFFWNIRIIERSATVFFEWLLVLAIIKSPSAWLLQKLPNTRPPNPSMVVHVELVIFKTFLSAKRPSSKASFTHIRNQFNHKWGWNFVNYRKKDGTTDHLLHEISRLRQIPCFLSYVHLNLNLSLFLSIFLFLSVCLCLSRSLSFPPFSQHVYDMNVGKELHEGDCSLSEGVWN